jgi:DNA-binding CsgD family transcriptional regulator
LAHQLLLSGQNPGGSQKTVVEMQTFNRWNVDLARAISVLGQDEFFPTLLQACRNQVSFACPQVWLYHPDMPPRLLADEVPEQLRTTLVDDYAAGTYRDNPFYKIAMNAPRSHIYRLQRLTQGNQKDDAFIKSFYEPAGIVDEVVFLTRLADGSVVNLSLLRTETQGPFTDDEYDRLYSMAEPIAAAIQSHCHRDDFAVPNLLKQGLDHQIETAFRLFGKDYLSGREHQVLEMMLRGYNTDTTAERLQISVETVRRHRKSTYKKLDVNSQADLFSLFINTMPYLANARGGDPLSVYMS